MEPYIKTNNITNNQIPNKKQTNNTFLTVQFALQQQKAVCLSKRTIAIACAMGGWKYECESRE
jgi:hypothetical protein